jgi:type II secretory pathway component PulM
MRRVIQMWQRLSTRERLLAGAAGAFLVLVAIRFGIVDPYRAYTARLETRIEREVERVRQMRERQESGPQVASRVQQLRERFSALEGRFIPGDTPALASARLQERLQSLAGKSGLELVTTQVMKAESVGEFQKALVQVTLRGELPAVASFLAGIEYSNWLLSVSTLEMRSTYGVRGRIAGAGRRRKRGQKTRPADKRPQPLTITLKVGGIMKKGTAS